MIFHPIVVLGFLVSKTKLEKWFSGFVPSSLIKILLLVCIAFIFFVLCGWLFYISQKFQRPILFDPEIEKNRKSDVEKQTEVLEKILEKLVK